VTGVCSPPFGDGKILGRSTLRLYKINFTKNGIGYDIVFDTVAKVPFSEMQTNTLPRMEHTYHQTWFSKLLFYMLWPLIWSSKRLKFSAYGLNSCSQLRTMLSLYRTSGREHWKWVIDQTLFLVKFQMHIGCGQAVKKAMLVINLIAKRISNFFPGTLSKKPWKQSYKFSTCLMFFGRKIFLKHFKKKWTTEIYSVVCKVISTFCPSGLWSERWYFWNPRTLTNLV